MGIAALQHCLYPLMTALALPLAALDKSSKVSY